MLIPEGFTEERVVDEIECAVRGLRLRFGSKFAGMNRDDVEQEIRAFAIEGINSGRYEPSRPLAGFLFTHCRNRLLNLYRNLVRRSDFPCKTCHEGGSCQDDGQQCVAYKKWRKRNDTKHQVYAPKGIDLISETRYVVDAQAENHAAANELSDLIDENLPIELRADYLRLLSGVHVTLSRRIQVQSAVLTILEENGLSAEDLKVCQEKRTTNRPSPSLSKATMTALQTQKTEQEEAVRAGPDGIAIPLPILSTAYGLTSSSPAETFSETYAGSGLV